MGSKEIKAGRAKVAVIGSQGVPPKYGGFETLVDNILGHRNADAVDYTVFCSAPDMGSTLRDYKGCRLKYVRLRAHGGWSVIYDMVSMLHALRGYDAILILGVSGCVFLPVVKMLSRTKVIVNIDGLEHRRDKWSNAIKKFLKFSLSMCVKWADTIVSDNKGIQDYVRDEYGCDATLIAYGGDHALRDIDERRQRSILDFYGLKAGEYDLSICRIEPENNCHLTLDAYKATGDKLVFVGNWNFSDYSRNLYTQYKDSKEITLLKSIYDLDILYALRRNARRYVHGHRAGGTNPSLVEAMFFGRPIMAFDVIYNRETTQNTAYYFDSSEALQNLLKRTDLDGEGSEQVAFQQYAWEGIARQYEALFTPKK